MGQPAERIAALGGGELQLGGVVGRFRQVALRCAPLQQLFLIFVHSASSSCLIASLSSDFEYQPKDPQ